MSRRCLMMPASPCLPRRVRHSWKPCRLQTFSGCWQARPGCRRGRDRPGRPPPPPRRGPARAAARRARGASAASMPTARHRAGCRRARPPCADGRRRRRVALAILDLAVQHLRGDREDIEAGVVEHVASRRHPRVAPRRTAPRLRFRLGDLAGGRVGDGLGIVDHRGRRRSRGRGRRAAAAAMISPSGRSGSGRAASSARNLRASPPSAATRRAAAPRGSARPARRPPRAPARYWPRNIAP